LQELRHENLNPFVGCFIDPFKPCLLFEFCTRSSLADVLFNADVNLDWEFKLSLMTDLIMGMRYLHSSAIGTHGNLNSHNCVIDTRWVLKITDFGVKTIYEFCKTKFPSADKKRLLWTAPEILRQDENFRHASQKGDVYSFAVIMQEILMRMPPYGMLDKEPEELLGKILKPPPLCRPAVPPGAAPPEYIQLMKQCWGEMAETRPSFEDIVGRFKSFTKGKKTNIVDAMFRKLEKYSNDLEETVRVRTLALEEERKKTESLLTQMLPASVAQSLLSGSPVDPESYEEVTVYFSDIVGFTTISAMSSPLQVVRLLNDLYTMFDSTIDDYDVYKVETIGDAYMACSGLPVRNGDRHAGEISTMALDLLSKCGQFVIWHMPDIPLRIRIGIHTGSCVAGVVGLRMPRFCLFGDTVNTASRMESTSTAFRIHVSWATQEKLVLLGGYEVVYRGEVELKGKGKHKTYWLVGKMGFNKPLPEPPAMTGLVNLVC
ncbi:hypothetical protein HELRODRAFT_62909, partial [Helobdella robusta]|uniref:Guanylate cyclase n=1 Tax=Helobdella robusta TaxID=6412 RepID=T1FX73_HELRO